MKKLGTIFLAIVLFILPSPVWTGEEQDIVGRISEIKDKVDQDYKCFYSYKSLGNLAIGLGIAGVLANTSADKEFQDWYKESLKNKETDNFSDVIEPFGDGKRTVPVYLGAAILGELTKDIKAGSTTGEWGGKVFKNNFGGSSPHAFLAESPWSFQTKRRRLSLEAS